MELSPSCYLVANMFFSHLRKEYQSLVKTLLCWRNHPPDCLHALNSNPKPVFHFLHEQIDTTGQIASFNFKILEKYIKQFKMNIFKLSKFKVLHFTLGFEPRVSSLILVIQTKCPVYHSAMNSFNSICSLHMQGLQLIET